MYQIYRFYLILVPFLTKSGIAFKAQLPTKWRRRLSTGLLLSPTSHFHGMGLLSLLIWYVLTFFLDLCLYYNKIFFSILQIQSDLSDMPVSDFMFWDFGILRPYLNNPCTSGLIFGMEICCLSSWDGIDLGSWILVQPYAEAL